VVLGEKRKTFRLQAGEMVGLAIYHRGLKLTPGDYEIVVLFYRDDDIEQKIPVVVSKPLLVNVPPEPKTDGKVKPNPFGPEAWLPYKVTKFADVTIKIYDKSGNLVRTADLGKKRPGEYFTKELAFQWDGRNDDGKKLPGGVYFCAIEENGEITSTRKTVILK
jgi:hypothetical protein